MLTCSIIIRHHDEEGQDGHIEIDLTFEGEACSHEVAILQLIKKSLEKISAIPVNELNTSAAETELIIYEMKHGNKFQQRK